MDVDLKDASGVVAVIWALKKARAMSDWLPTTSLFLLLILLEKQSKRAEVGRAKALDRSCSRPDFCGEQEGLSVSIIFSFLNNLEGRGRGGAAGIDSNLG